MNRWTTIAAVDTDKAARAVYATGYEDAEHARSLGRDIEWSREDGK